MRERLEASPQEPGLRRLPQDHGSRSAWRSRTSTPSACGAPTTAARRSIRAASCSTARSSTARSSLRQALLNHADAFVAELRRESAELRARPGARLRATCRRCAPIVRERHARQQPLLGVRHGVVKSVPFQMRNADASGTDGDAQRATETRKGARLMFITKKHCRGARCSAAWAPRSRCRCSRRWCRRRRRCAERAAVPEEPLRRHRDGARLRRQHRVRHGQATSGSPATDGRDFEFTHDPEAARAVPRLPHGRQPHRLRAAPMPFTRRGSRRRPLPLERGVPDRARTRSRPKAPTSTTARRSIRSTRRSSARTRRCRRSSCASRTSIRPAPAATTTAASTWTRSAGSSPTTPLPMTLDPRLAFEELFGTGGIAGGSRRPQPRQPQHPRRHHPRRRPAAAQPGSRRIAAG